MVRRTGIRPEKVLGAALLSDQKTAERFAAQKVSITGTLDPKTRTILVESMAAAE